MRSKFSLKRILAPLAAATVALSGVVGLGHLPAAYAVDPAPGTTVGAIHSPGLASNNQTVSGNVREIVRYGTNNGLDSLGQEAKGLEGVKVYFQWYEGQERRGRYASPVYYAVSDSQGNFTIDAKPYLDDRGRVRAFDGNPTVGAAGTKALNGLDSRDGWKEKVRIWSELSDSDNNYRLQAQYAASPAPDQSINDLNLFSTWDAGKHQLKDVFINYQDLSNEPQHLPEELWYDSASSQGRGLNGSVSGVAAYNLTVPNGALDLHTYTEIVGDPRIPGLEIVGSYLSDSAIDKIKAHVDQNFGGKALRGAGWTAQDEKGLQRWIHEQVAANPTEWIAETSKAVTDQNGEYHLYFRGTYGFSSEECGTSAISRTCAKNPDGSYKYWHKIAENWGDGTFANISAGLAKHVNTEWMYVAPKDLPSNVGLASPYSMARWVDGAADNDWGGGAFAPTVAVNGKSLDYVTFQNMYLSLSALRFDITNYDSQANQASRGDIAKTATSGLVNGKKYTIDWPGTGKSCTFTAGADTTIPSCDFQVPEDLATTTTYVANLYDGEGTNGAFLGSDTFTARVPQDLAWGSRGDDYTGSVAITTDPAAGNIPLNYSDYTVAPELQENLVLDTATGAVTGKPTTAGTTDHKVNYNVSFVPEGRTETVTQEASYNTQLVVTDTPLATGQVGTEYDQTVTPTGFEAAGYTLQKINSVEGLPAGLTYANNKITGTPTVTVDATEETPNVTVKYTVVNAAGETKEVTDIVPLKIGETEATVYTPAYTETRTAPGKTVSSAAPTFTDKDGATVDKPEGATFAVDTAKLPAGLTAEMVSIDEATGVVTLKTPADAANETVYDIPVIVTYKDNSTDNVTAPFKVYDQDGDGVVDPVDPDNPQDGEDKCADTPAGATVDADGCTLAQRYTPVYTDTPAVVGVAKTSAAPTFDDVTTKDVVETLAYDALTQGKGTDAEKTVAATFATAKDGATVGTDGAVTWTPDQTGRVEIPVNVTYPDTTVDADVPAPFVVEDSQANTNDPAYEDKTGKPGETVTVPQTGDTEMPAGTKYAEKTDNPNVTVNADTGELTVTIPNDATPGSEITGTITVTYPDGSSEDITYKVTVLPNDAQKFEPAYTETRTAPGKTVSSAAPTFTGKDGAAVDKPEGATFKIDEAKLPTGITAEMVSIDADTGVVTLKTPADAANETVWNIPVIVTYQDGTMDNVTAPFKVYDQDGDGVVDPVDPDNPKDGEDKCAETPAGAEVDANGCAVAPTLGDVPNVNGTIGVEITPIEVPVTNTGMNENLTCTATDLPAGLSVALKADGSACVISGTPTEKATDKPFTVTLTYDKPDGDKTAGTPIVKNGTATIGDKPDADGDGVPDDMDQCAETPAGAEVDANGCAVAPTLGDVPNVNGTIGVEITPIEVPVTNTGMNENLTCTATDLPAGLSVALKADGSACVISGTPTEKATDKPFTVTLTYDKPDGDKTAGTPIVKNGTATIGDKPDADGDGVPDDMDQCAETPAGAEVDANGCAVAPTLGDVPNVNGTIGVEITPIEVPVTNTGMNENLTCTATDLPAGLSVALKADGSACVISGTPTEKATDKPFTVTLTYDKPDGDKTAGTPIVKNGTATIGDKPDADGDGVPDDMDQCAETPAGAEVDANGCAVAPTLGDVPNVNGTIGVEITPIEVPVTNTGMNENLTCTANDLPAGLSVALKADGSACVISGTPTEKATDKPFTVTLTYDKPDGDKTAGTPIVKNGTATIGDKPDADGDGVPDDMDQCAETPAGAEVDANGCAVAPTLGDVPNVNGTIGVEITPIEVPVTNTGMNENLTCTATDLPAGLSVALKADGSACVISGTPTEKATDKPFTVTLTYDKPDGDKTAGTPIVKNGTATIGDKPDADGDGVPDDMDQCAETPAGAEVDANGCAVAPVIPNVPAITGEKDKPIDPITIPIENPGKATDLVCKATGLPAGLNIGLNEDGTACVVTGTPTVATDGPVDVTVTVEYNKPDGDKGPGTVTKDGTANITVPVPGDADGDGVPDNADKCADTPAGATVDANGCAVVPSIPNDLPNIVGEKDEPIDPITIPIENPGKATDLVCKATGLAAGLMIEYVDGKGCVISGTPTEVKDGDYTVTIESKRPDGDKGDNTPVVKDNGKIKITEAPVAPNWEDTTGKPGDDVVIPNTGGEVPDGATIETNGPGTAILDKDGNINVTINEDAKPGDKVIVTVKDKDGNPIDTVTITVVEKPVAPNWEDTTGKPGDDVVIPNTGGEVPDGATIETNGPGTAILDKDGNINVTINEDAKPGDKVVVTVKDKDGNPIDTVTITVVEKPVAPNWEDTTGKPGDDVVIPNTGGEVPDGATIETNGPGTAILDKDGNINVTINEDAKPGDKVVVTVKDKDGNIIDTVTITVAEKPVAPTIKEKLAKTGLDIAGLAAIGLGSLLIGAFAVMRRRKES